MFFPLNYDQINLYNGTFTPSDKFADSLAYDFWCRALYQRALSVFDFDGLPEEFSRDEISLLYYLLYANGFCGSVKLNEYGTIINPITLGGYNIFYSPSWFLLTNPAINGGMSKHFDVYHLGQDDKDTDKYGVILSMSPDYEGIADIIVYYAEKLANMSAALDMNIENSKLAYVMGANSKSGVSFLKKLMDKVKAGVSTIVFDSRITPVDDVDTFEWFSRDNLKNSYMITEFNTDIQTLVNQFDAEIGIVNVPYEKKERMTAFESQSKASDGIARATLWRDNLQRSFDEFNELFGYNVKVRYNYEYMIDTESDDLEGGDINE